MLTTLPGKIAGIATRQGGYVVTGSDAKGNAVLFLVNASGKLERSIVLPDAIFLNGIERISVSEYVIADSYKGVIWKFNSSSGDVALWLDSPLLKRQDEKNPIPAANGVRKQGNELIVSNTQRMTLVRVPIQASGAAGEAKVWKERINIDDFAVATDGSLIATTHVYNNVVRIAPDGAVTIIADATQGLSGSTSAALSKDGKTAYVTTNGGMFLPPPEGVIESRVLAIDITKPSVR